MAKFKLSTDDYEDLRESVSELPDSRHLNKLISNAIVLTEWDHNA